MVRRLQQRIAVVASVLMVTGAGLVAAAPPASAAATLSVSPSTGLTGATSAVVTGSGWVPNDQIAICQAPASVPPPIGVADCSGGFAATYTADAAGSFAPGFFINRLINVPALGRWIDCADPATPCVIAAVDVNDIPASLVTVPLGFLPPPLPTLQPLSSSDVEGNAGTRDVLLPVAIINPNVQTITTTWRTVFIPGAPGDQADPSTDYTPTSGTVSFAPGTTVQWATISVHGDTNVEGDEFIAVQFDKPANANLGGDTAGGLSGLGYETIVNDDVIVVTPGGGSVVEGNSGTTALHVSVALSAPSPQTITVQWLTGYAGGASGIEADPATDYTPASGTVTFAPGETQKSVSISVNGDTVVEPDEWIIVGFYHPTNARMGGFWGLTFAEIVNDDVS